jgi:hypothetical protein
VVRNPKVEVAGRTGIGIGTRHGQEACLTRHRGHAMAIRGVATLAVVDTTRTVLSMELEGIIMGGTFIQPRFRRSKAG